jgi:trimethylamine--corrinoid protein Co-methyltransferase
MGASAVGGREKLKDRPVFMGGCCNLSPLVLSKGVCETIIEISKVGVPLMDMSMVLAGGTGPVTLAGTVILNNVEVLGALVLHQLVRKGSPFIYASSTSILQMQNAMASIGCPELGLLNAALAKLAHSYNLPSVVAGG